MMRSELAFTRFLSSTAEATPALRPSVRSRAQFGRTWTFLSLPWEQHLRALTPGWDGRRAPLPNERALSNARALVRYATLRHTVHPDVEGGLVVRFEAGDRRVDFFCDNDGDVTALHVTPASRRGEEVGLEQLGAVVKNAEVFLGRADDVENFRSVYSG